MLSLSTRELVRWYNHQNSRAGHMHTLFPTLTAGDSRAISPISKAGNHQRMAENIKGAVLSVSGTARYARVVSTLQHTFKPTQSHAHSTVTAHDFLDNFHWISCSLRECAIHFFKIIPMGPCVIGTTDASCMGMGGIIFIPTNNSMPKQPNYQAWTWNSAFPMDIVDSLVFLWESRRHNQQQQTRTGRNHHSTRRDCPTLPGQMCHHPHSSWQCWNHILAMQGLHFLQ